jgi:hypothetical protein
MVGPAAFICANNVHRVGSLRGILAQAQVQVRARRKRRKTNTAFARD